VDSIADRVMRAADIFRRSYGEGKSLVVAGGVAANTALKDALTNTAAKAGMALAVPPVALCTDNAVMIAWAGVERLKLGLTDALDFKARPRWPLDPDAPKATGAGVKA
jgi:N6-L-threonylcarbamoyladenine synthase